MGFFSFHKKPATDCFEIQMEKNNNISTASIFLTDIIYTTTGALLNFPPKFAIQNQISHYLVLFTTWRDKTEQLN